MIQLSGQLICKTKAEADIVRAHLPDHIRLSRAEPGCLSFNVTQDADQLVWSVSESFTNRAAFDAHQARTRASLWGQATAHLERRFNVTGG
jgi:quinol monooxygenase YgiN